MATDKRRRLSLIAWVRSSGEGWANVMGPINPDEIRRSNAKISYVPVLFVSNKLEALYRTEARLML